MHAPRTAKEAACAGSGSGSVGRTRTRSPPRTSSDSLMKRVDPSQPSRSRRCSKLVAGAGKVGLPKDHVTSRQTAGVGASTEDDEQHRKRKPHQGQRSRVPEKCLWAFHFRVVARIQPQRAELRRAESPRAGGRRQVGSVKRLGVKSVHNCLARPPEADAGTGAGSCRRGAPNRPGPAGPRVSRSDGGKGLPRHALSGGEPPAGGTPDGTPSAALFAMPA